MNSNSESCQQWYQKMKVDPDRYRQYKLRKKLQMRRYRNGSHQRETTRETQQEDPVIRQHDAEMDAVERRRSAAEAHQNGLLTTA